MTAATAQKNIPAPYLKKKKAKRISWATFEKKYLTREDNYKYEWVNGVVEKTKRIKNNVKFVILINIREEFENCKKITNNNGYLAGEIHTFFAKDIHCQPNLSYFSNMQAAKMAHGENQIPEFVIEIISSNDQVNRLQKKMKNYREAGVKVVWQIYPELEEVHISKGGNSKVLSGENLCSAEPVLPEFEISVKDLFKMPPKPEGMKEKS